MPSRQKWTGRTAVITFDDGYVDNLAAVEELRERGMRATWFVVTGSIGESPKWPADGRPKGRLLNADELRDMQACGMEIGSHTVNHVRLTEADDVRLTSELVDSKVTLEDLLGSTVGKLCLPLRRLGCALCRSRETGWLCGGLHHPYRMGAARQQSLPAARLTSVQYRHASAHSPASSISRRMLWIGPA